MSKCISKRVWWKRDICLHYPRQLEMLRSHKMTWSLCAQEPNEPLSIQGQLHWSKILQLPQNISVVNTTTSTNEQLLHWLLYNNCAFQSPGPCQSTAYLSILLLTDHFHVPLQVSPSAWLPIAHKMQSDANYPCSFMHQRRQGRTGAIVFFSPPPHWLRRCVP